MQKSDLEMHGDALQTIISMAGGDVTQYYRVHVQGSVVGVGIFHNHSTLCTFALIRNEADDKQMLGKISDEFPLAVDELYQLEAYFYELFPE